jgi:hypothetical protein
VYPKQCHVYTAKYAGFDNGRVLFNDFTAFEDVILKFLTAAVRRDFGIKEDQEPDVFAQGTLKLICRQCIYTHQNHLHKSTASVWVAAYTPDLRHYCPSDARCFAQHNNWADTFLIVNTLRCRMLNSVDGWYKCEKHGVLA